MINSASANSAIANCSRDPKVVARCSRYTDNADSTALRGIGCSILPILLVTLRSCYRFLLSTSSMVDLITCKKQTCYEDMFILILFHMSSFFMFSIFLIGYWWLQEFMILPIRASSFKEAMKMGVKVYHHLKVNLKSLLFLRCPHK